MDPLAVTIISGGMDSVTLAYSLADEGYDQIMLSFDYGQRHAKEMHFAKMAANDLNARHHVVDLRSINPLMKGSALTEEDIAVPEGHYAADNMAITVVPNRNALMLAVAYAVAVSHHAVLVATGVHAGDHFQYPDCRPSFLRSFELMETLATEGFSERDLQLWAPFENWTKAEIVELGAALNVPYRNTWSCYKGGEVHCGRCGTCLERHEAFVLARVLDPTEYLDLSLYYELRDAGKLEVRESESAAD